jgi:hypothetical protein
MFDVSGFPAISKGATIGRHPALRHARADWAGACLGIARSPRERFAERRLVQRKKN